MKIRTFHRTCAIIFSPLFLFSAISGCALLLRKAHLYSEDVEDLIASFHTWEVIAPYIGIVLACGLLTVTITGIILFFNRRA